MVKREQSDAGAGSRNGGSADGRTYVRIAGLWGVLICLLCIVAAADDVPKFVKRIEFEGNEYFPPSRLLRLVELKPSGIFRRAAFSRWILAMDTRAIEAFYHAHGFFRASVVATVEADDDKPELVRIRFRVVEGPRVTVRSVKLADNPLDGVLGTGGLKTVAGNPLVHNELALDAVKIRETLRQKGFLAAKVEPLVEVDSIRHEADVRFDIASGPCVLVGEEVSEGGGRIRTIVIDRALAFRRGDTLTGERIRDSERNLYRTGLFSLVRVRPQLDDSAHTLSPSDTALPVNVILEQADHFSLEGAIGYSSIEIYRASLLLSYANAFRLGHRAIVEGGVSGIEQYVGVGYSIPWLLRVPLAFEVNGFYRRHDTLLVPVSMGYSGEFVGFTLTTARTTDLGLSYRVRYRYENVLNLESSSQEDLSAAVREKNTRSIGVEMAFDRLNDIRIPKRGMYGVMSAELAGLSGGKSNQFVKVRAGLRGYTDVVRYLVVGSGLTVGWVGPYGASRGVPAQEKFFAGGPRSVRGYNYQRLVTDEEGKPRGGNAYAVAHIFEVRFPLFWWFYGAVFLDAGYVWRDLEEVDLGDLKYGAGPGLRMATPIGLVRFDMGFKLRPVGDESTVEIYLDVGHAF